MTSTMIFIDHTANDLNADRDTCVILGRRIDLNASCGANYDWVDNGTLVGCTTSSSSEVIPLIETTYTVNITNDNGFSYTDQITVCVIKDPFS